MKIKVLFVNSKTLQQGMMQEWRRVSIVVVGLIESLLFSGCLFGWPSLLHVLQQEGVYRHLCTNGTDEILTTTIFSDEGTSTVSSFTEFELNVSNISEMHPSVDICKEQAVQMTLIYTVAAVSYGLTSILIGFSLDIFGLWFTRIIGCIMTSGGFCFLAFTSQERSWFLWPALNLIALGTSQLRLSSFQFANLWPQYRTTILIFYSSAYSVSTTLFLLIQIAYVGSIPYKIIGLSLTAVSLLTFPPTLIMPRMKIEDHVNDNDAELELKDSGNPKKATSISSIADDATRIPQRDSADSIPRILRNKREDNKLMNPFDEEEPVGKGKQRLPDDNVPLGTSLWTLSAGLHILWHFITFFLVLFYSSTFLLWIQMMTTDPKTIEHYNTVSGLCALVAPIFIPIAGLVTDWQIRQASKLEDREERLAVTMQAPAMTKAIASMFVLGTMICKVYLSSVAVYLSMGLIAVSRPFIVGSCASYIRIRFHPSHFNRLNGIFTTIVSILCLVQFPIIVWMKQSEWDFKLAQLVLIGILVLAFISPGHIMVKSLARKYARAQLKYRTDI